MRDPRLEQLLHLEATVRQQLADPTVAEVRIPNQFTPQQLQISPVYAGPDGRLWAMRGQTLSMVFGPEVKD